MRSALLGLLVFLFVPWGCREQAARPYAYQPATANQGADVQEHIDFLEDRLKTRPKSFLEQAELAGYYLQKARADGDARALEKAEEWADRSLEITPSPGAQLVKADLLQMKHDFGEALELVRQVLAQENGNGNARLMAVKILLAQGKAQEASEMLEAVPEQPLSGLYLLRGRAAEARDDLDAARELYRKALQAEGHTGTARESKMLRAVWARMELEAGNLEQAGQLLASAGDIPVDLPLMDLVRVDLALARENYDQAAELSREAFARHHDPLLLKRLARVQQAQGKPDRARESLQTAADLLGQDALGHERDLAEILLELDPQAHAENIKVLIARDLERRQDEETLRIKARVEEKLGPLDDQS